MKIYPDFRYFETSSSTNKAISDCAINNGRKFEQMLFRREMSNSVKLKQNETYIQQGQAQLLNECWDTQFV